jgi:PAS domain S-box-containing protein
VLKFVIKDPELDEILQEVRMGTTGHAMLLGTDGRVLICPLRPPGAHHPVQIKNTDSQTGWFMQKNGHGNGQTVVAFSLVSLTTTLNTQNVGVRPWRVAITQERSELFAPIHRALWAISGLGTILVGILVLLGILAGKKLIRPILALQQGSEVLARGNLGYRLQIKTHDELEALANTINHMAESLQQRTSDLLAARDYLRNIIEQSAVLIITTHPTYEIREFNRGAEEILGYDRNQIVGKSLELIWDDPDEFRQVAAQLTLKGQRISYETTFARSDGTPVPVSFSLTQLTDETGSIIGLVVVGENITHRKQLEESRLKAERLMALHRLSTLLTHDLRSPMVGILKALALLKESYGKMPQDQAQQLLSDLVRGGDLLLGTLNDLLDVYRHSLSAIPLRYAEFLLAEAIEETIPLLEVDAKAREIKLEIKLASRDLTISADRRRIQRVIFNLLDNAIKHSPSGGLVTLHEGAVEEGQIHLQVEDQGSGIPCGEFSRIFDFLYEPPGDQRGLGEHSGIGVGLYFCRVTVEAHGGCIWAENRTQGGARFTISLPLTSQRSIRDGSKS